MPALAEYENFAFSVIEKAIELRRPNIIGDDSVFVFDLLVVSTRSAISCISLVPAPLS